MKRHGVKLQNKKLVHLTPLDFNGKSPVRRRNKTNEIKKRFV